MNAKIFMRIIWTLAILILISFAIIASTLRESALALVLAGFCVAYARIQEGKSYLTLRESITKRKEESDYWWLSFVGIALVIVGLLTLHRVDAALAIEGWLGTFVVVLLYHETVLLPRTDTKQLDEHLL